MKRSILFLCATLIAGLLVAGAIWWGWVGRRALQPEADVTRPATQTVYVVQQIPWRFTARGNPYVAVEGRPGTPVKVFANRERADVFCRDLNRQKQSKENPFRYQPEEPAGGSYLDFYTTRGEDAFLALVRSEGLTPPTRDRDPYKDYDGLDSEPWVKWWQAHRPGWDDRLVARLWDAIDRVRFYEVVEVDLER